MLEKKICLNLEAGNYGGEGGLMSKGTISGQELVKGSFRGSVGRGRKLHAKTAQSALTVILKLAMWSSEKHHLDCFEHS